MSCTHIKPVTSGKFWKQRPARLQSLIFAITTAGFNKEGICYEQRDYAIKVLKNFDNPDPLSIKDDSYFALIYTPDEGDDPFDEANWPKANPGPGYVSVGTICAARQKAKEQVAARVGFTKHLNIWVQGESMDGYGALGKMP